MKGREIEWEETRREVWEGQGGGIRRMERTAGWKNKENRKKRGRKNGCHKDAKEKREEYKKT